VKTAISRLSISRKHFFLLYFSPAFPKSLCLAIFFCKFTAFILCFYRSKSNFAEDMRKSLGKAGENAAAAYLEKEDYLIRHRNWRKGHFELDIVCSISKLPFSPTTVMISKRTGMSI